MTFLRRIFGRLGYALFGNGLSVSNSGTLLLKQGRRTREVSWAAVARVDVRQFDAWIHVICVQVWLDGVDQPVGESERNEGYEQLAAAIRKNLRPFDDDAWDYVHSGFFADVSRTVYMRPS